MSFAEKIDNCNDEIYQIRASLIIFGENTTNNKIEGVHLISYSGYRPEFRNRKFDDQSDAYKVVNQEHQSIFIYDPNKEPSQNRYDRTNQSDYKTYILFRINDFSVLTVDWPSLIKQEDDIFDTLKTLFQKSICPKIAQVIDIEKENILESRGLKAISY